jgi:RHS repeat-associated protein
MPDAGLDPAVAARSASDIPQAGDPVDVATGDVVLFQDDVSLPGTLALVIGRAYRSSWRAGRWFGTSWASSFDQRLHVGPDRIVGVFADGRVLTWLCDPAEDRPVPLTGLPVTGPRWRLAAADGGAFTVTDLQAGVVQRFEGEDTELSLVSLTDRAGRQICFSYTAAGEPAWVTHSGGCRIRVVVDGGRITALQLAGAAGPPIPLAGYSYDEAGNLTGVADGAGQVMRFGYDRDGRLAGWQDRNGISYRYSYDELGRCVAGTGRGGVMSGRFAYGDRVTWWTDACGAVTIYQLDSSSRVTTVTSPLGHVTHVWYDEYGRVRVRADPLGRLTRYDYDENGSLSAITWPDGRQDRASYDRSGLLAALDMGGGRWRYDYDRRGNLVRRTAPDQAVTSYGYDEHGNLASITGPLGEETTVQCDPAGLPLVVTSPAGGGARCTRDVAGRVISVAVAGHPATTLTWTAAGRLASRRFPDGTSEHWAYDAEGNLAGYLSPNGERTSYEYGPSDRLTAVTSPDGTRTELRYDRALRLTAVVRAGLTWRYAYDAVGQVVAETDFNGAVTHFTYDPAGQLTRRVNAAGQQVTYGYDELGRLVQRRAGGAVTTFGYDAAGHLVHARNPSAEIRLSRDPLGRITAESCNDRTVLSSFDLAGRRTRRVTPGGLQQRWHYDPAGQPARLETAGHTLEFGYDQAGRETRRELPGAVTLAQEWDEAGQLTLQALTPAGQPASGPADCRARRAYAYRPDGCLVGVDDLLAGPRRFTLDDRGRVTEVSGPQWDEQYRYDPAGNVASARWSSPPPQIAGRWLSADLQGSRERAGTLITSAGTVHYRHDDQGRVILRQRARRSGPPDVWSYEWDPDDRLTAVTTPDGSTWRYRYDPLGRRISKQQFGPSGAPGKQATYTWDGAVLAEETAGTPETGHHRVTWDHWPGTFAALTQTESVSATDGGRPVTAERFHAIVTDQVGMPAELVDADGRVAGYQQHTLWGGTLWHPAGPATPLRFPGQYFDPETGLHYNHQRYYDPVTGSYLTPDPLGLAPAPNPHAYVPNPLLLADPLGLMSCARDGMARFITTSSGDILDTSRITIPEPKFGYLLKNPSKAGVFSDSMGFEPQDLDGALRAHLTRNFGTATESVPMVGGGTKFSVTGAMTGPSSARWDITTAWGIGTDALVRLITATPRRR